MRLPVLEACGLKYFFTIFCIEHPFFKIFQHDEYQNASHRTLGDFCIPTSPVLYPTLFLFPYKFHRNDHIVLSLILNLV
jgi:hypothetical protein